MNPYNSPQRISSDQGGSVDKTIPYVQRGQFAGKINSANSFIPCDLDIVEQFFLTPVKITDSDNQVCLFTTVVGWEVDSLSTLKALSDIDDWGTGVLYEIGTIVDGNVDDTVAYVALTKHTAAATFAADLADRDWLALATTTFIKLVHTAGGSGDVVNINYEIHGRMTR